MMDLQDVQLQHDMCSYYWHLVSTHAQRTSSRLAICEINVCMYVCMSTQALPLHNEAFLKEALAKE